MYRFILLKNQKTYKFNGYYNEIERIDKLNYCLKFALLLLLITNFTFYNSDKLYLKTDEKNEYNYTMKNHSLYNLIKYPQISILIFYTDKTDKLLNFAKQLLDQTLKDIQILIFFKNDNKKRNNNFIRKFPLNDNRINIMEFKTLEENIFQIIDKIKGKFTLIIDKIINFGQQQLENFYNFTKGKINNIFEFKIEHTYLYLIKTKLLSNLLDEGNFIFEFNDLINYIKEIPFPNLNHISIAFCPNNIYTPLTYVAMLSVLKTKSSNTYISFYFIIPKDYKSSNKEFLLSLYDQFDYFNITFITMDDRYKKAYVSRRMSLQTYYRFSLGELLPNLNKIIYLDGDVIVYKDLCNLYNLNFNGKFVLGQVTGNNRNKRTGVYRINNGILVFNLYNMRKFKIEEKAIEIIKKGKHFFYHDQTLMNDYFKNYIGIFQIEYHIRNWRSIENIKKFNRGSGHVYDDDVFYFSSKYPSIRHFLGSSKPTKKDIGHTEDWWYFARLSKFYVTKSHESEKIFNFTFT